MTRRPRFHGGPREIPPTGNSVRATMSDWEWEELRDRALRRAERGDGTMAEIAREAGISVRTLHRWTRR